MSYTVILGPRELHNVSTPDAYRRAHARAIGRLVGAGARVMVHVMPGPKAARIDFGNWVIDCECGAGNATDPTWGIACCFGCGAVHEDIVFPPPQVRAAIEQLVLARPRIANRFWSPGETVAHVRADNLTHGVRSEEDQRALD